MAEKVELEVAINSAGAASNLTELRKSLKELVSLQGQVGSGDKGFKKLADAINETEGKIGDLNDGFNTLRGSGVERLSSSLGLLKEGLLTGDVDKAKTAFTGLGSAMSAIPIFLIIEGLKYLYDNFDKIKGLLFDTTNEVENNKAAMAALAKQNEETQKTTDAYIASLEKEVETLSLTNAPLREQIALRNKITNVQVESLDKQIKKKQEDILITEKQIEANKKLLETAQLQAAGISSGYESTVKAQNDALNFTLDNQKKELSSLESLNISKENVVAKGEASKKSILDKAAGEQAVRDKKIYDDAAKLRKRDADADAAVAASNKEFAEQEKRDKEQELADAVAIVEKEKALREKNLADSRALTVLQIQDKTNEVSTRLALLDQLYAEDIARAEKNGETHLAIDKRYADQRDAINKESSDKQKVIDKQVNDAKVQTTAASLNALSSLSATYFNLQSRRAKGNASEELKLKKQAFYLDKGISVTKATIDGIRSVQGALAQTATLGPAAIVLAAANGVAAAANVAAIASQQFDGGGASGPEGATPTSQDGIINSPGVGNLGGPSQGFNSTAQAFNPSGINRSQLGAQRVYVLESDITNTQNRVQTAESRATFG